MSQMRFHQILKGQIFTSTAFTWNTTYAKILIKEDLEASAPITAVTALSTVDATGWDLTDTFDFIYPFSYEYTTVIDGVLRGNVRLNVGLDWTGLSEVGEGTYAKINASLIAITSGGTETVLATVDSITYQFVGTAGAHTHADVDLPFWVFVDNAQVPNGSKMLLRIKTYLDHYGDDFYKARSHGSLNSALNSNNIMVDLPIVV